MQILKGRLISLALFGSYCVASALSPMVALGMVVAFILLSPFFICLSLKFQMKMTSYRNVRFGFTGRYGKALLVFIVLPILSLFTLYLTMPWVLKKMDEFIFSQVQYGRSKAQANLSVSAYYKASFIALMVSLLVFGFMAVVIAGLFILTPSLMEGVQSGSFNLATALIMFLYLIAIAIISSFYSAMVRNHVFNNSQIANVVTLRSTVSRRALAGLRVTNLVAIIFTLGFAFAWAKIRTAKFMAQATEVAILPGIEDIIVDNANQASALGEEVSDVFDFDVSLT
jgi:uncharacterized membrane protein YjgN (DUF898 family)